MSTINYTCTCGKQVRFRSEHAGRKTKCPECGTTITVPDADTDDLDDYDEEDAGGSSHMSHRSSGSGRSVTGKRVIAQWGQIVPSMFGRTTLEIMDGCLVDNTQSLLTRRHLELLLSEIDSAEIRITPNAAFLGAGIVLLPLFGLGLLVLPFYFISKYKFLIFHSGSNTTALVISGKEDPYREFMQLVLTAAQKAKRQH